MTLHLIRAQVDLAGLGRWVGDRGWARRGRAEHYDEGAVLHHLLVEVFGARAIHPFRLMVPPGGRVANLYGYASSDAGVLQEAATVTMLPEVASVLDPSGLRSKPMPGEWSARRQVGFDLRLRPVVRIRKPLGHHTAGSEVDAFLAEALRDYAGDAEGMKNAGRSREQVYAGWLAQRIGSVARIETCRLVRFSRSRAVRHGRAVEGPDIVLQGDMTITDPDAFSDLLASGIGRHRAYGYGMLLLRPPGTRAPTC